MTPILDLQGLCHSFPGFELADVDLQVQPGSIQGLIGPSGAGKSTLMKLVMGQFQPDSGSVKVCGLSYPANLKEIRNRVGYVGEDPPFAPKKRVTEVVGFAALYYSLWNSDRFNQLLGEFDIDLRQRINALSRGRKSLLALALALAHEPDLLLLDEPTAGLDAISRRQVLRLMAEFVADGDRAVVIATHQTDGLAPLADRMAFLHRGRLILAADTEELLASWKWLRYRSGALPDKVADELVSHENGAFGNRGLIRNFATVQPELAPGLASGDIQAGNATLDDILICLTEGN